MIRDDLLTNLQSDSLDEKAFNEWYESEYPALFYNALFVTQGNRQLAEDLCQDVIVTFVLEGFLRKVRSANEANAYLNRMVLNGYIDSVRKSQREVELSIEDEPAQEFSAVEDLDAAETYKGVLNVLDPVEQVVLSMMLAGESLDDISKSCNITYSSAGVKVHRIRKKIKKLIKT